MLLPGTPEYDADQIAYWSVQQTELHPRCRFLPQTALDVRDALHLAETFNISVALVSGGHSSNQGASNIASGITIDLALLSSVEIAEDNQSVWIGPGARWSDVYASLEPYNLTVAGGRVGHVGVGGYVLGGGFSWHANREGWSCDSVLEFSVVTPDLEILQASAYSHADLFWALKGSLGAFGVVTDIKMKTIPNFGFYGGAISYDEDALLALYAALKEMPKNTEIDPDTSGYLSFAYSAKTAGWVHNAYLINTANSSTSPAIGNFLMIPNKGHNLRHMTPKESADEIAASNPLSFRRSKFTLTILPTTEAMQLVHDFVKGFAGDMQLSDDELLGVTYQPLTVPHLHQQDNIFSNVLTADYGPLMLISVELWWKDDDKDAYYEKEFRGLYEDGLAFGLGWMLVLHAWAYPNYAASWQEPLSRWRLGNESWTRLQEVTERYDPQEVWRRLVPGIWHI